MKFSQRTGREQATTGSPHTTTPLKEATHMRAVHTMSMSPTPPQPPSRRPYTWTPVLLWRRVMSSCCCEPACPCCPPKPRGSRGTPIRRSCARDTRGCRWPSLRLSHTYTWRCVPRVGPDQTHTPFFVQLPRTCGPGGQAGARATRGGKWPSLRLSHTDVVHGGRSCGASRGAPRGAVGPAGCHPSARLLRAVGTRSRGADRALIPFVHRQIARDLG